MMMMMVMRVIWMPSTSIVYGGRNHGHLLAGPSTLIVMGANHVTDWRP